MVRAPYIRLLGLPTVADLFSILGKQYNLIQRASRFSARSLPWRERRSASWTPFPFGTGGRVRIKTRSTLPFFFSIPLPFRFNPLNSTLLSLAMSLSDRFGDFRLQAVGFLRDWLSQDDPWSSDSDNREHVEILLEELTPLLVSHSYRFLPSTQANFILRSNIVCIIPSIYGHAVLSFAFAIPRPGYTSLPTARPKLKPFRGFSPRRHPR